MTAAPVGWSVVCERRGELVARWQSARRLAANGKGVKASKLSLLPLTFSSKLLRIVNVPANSEIGDAMEAVGVMAVARYGAAGVPTAMVVEMRNRDAAVIATYA